jgi:type IV pilus assembly protein PilZ
VTDSNQDSEQRFHPRTPIELKVEYRRLNTFFADYTKNISRGGTFIKTNKPLGVGTHFVFKLVVPTLEDPIVLSGRVQWTVQPGEETATDDAPGMGIKFMYSDDDERTAVELRVERLMIDSLGKHLYTKLLKRHSSIPPKTE